jgi:membrane-bound metal-dependent hydrolase YbcI (DUF457 family)
MWPPGHVAIAYLLYRASIELRSDVEPSALPVLVLGFGSLFPDLVDKPLAWYLGAIPTGRTLAHSLLLLVPLSVGVYLLARRYDRDECGIAFAVGALSHSLVDALPALWDPETDAAFLLWPLLSVEPYEGGPPTITALFLDSLSEPYFLLEFVLLGVALALWRRDGYPGVRPFRDAVVRLG